MRQIALGFIRFILWNQLYLLTKTFFSSWTFIHHPPKFMLGNWISFLFESSRTEVKLTFNTFTSRTCAHLLTYYITQDLFWNFEVILVIGLYVTFVVTLTAHLQAEDKLLVNRPWSFSHCWPCNVVRWSHRSIEEGDLFGSRAVFPSYHHFSWLQGQTILSIQWNPKRRVWIWDAQ